MLYVMESIFKYSKNVLQELKYQIVFFKVVLTKGADQSDIINYLTICEKNNTVN